ncbi:MAG: hypothetical protein AB1744_14870, partial [Candidatus Zixiibacteriota bacterium]
CHNLSWGLTSFAVGADKSVVKQIDVINQKWLAVESHVGSEIGQAIMVVTSKIGHELKVDGGNRRRQAPRGLDLQD